MKVLKTILVMTLISTGFPLAHGEIYKIVDDSGKVTFTDIPPNGSGASDKKVQLGEPNTQLPIAIPEKTLQSTGYEIPVVKYQFVKIIQPSNNTTIPPGQLEVVIQASSQPSLQTGHLLRVLYDGQPVAPPAETTSVTIRDLYRGAHQVKAQIVDDKHRVLIESNAVTIHVKRPTKLINP